MSTPVAAPAQHLPPQIPTSPPRRRHRPARSAFVRSILHVTRRSHMYAGLLLVPWVLLYGVTAFLFNHPTVFSDQAIYSITKSSLTGTPMEKFPRLSELAAQVVAELNATQGDTYELIQPERAQFARGLLTANVTDANRGSFVAFFQHGGTGVLREAPTQADANSSSNKPAAAPAAKPESGQSESTAKAEPKEAPASAGSKAEGVAKNAGTAGGVPFATKDLKLKNSPLSLIAEGFPVVLERMGFPESTVTGIRATVPLSFRIQKGDERWQAEYNLNTGALTGKPLDATVMAADQISFRWFLLRMHRAHGYPGDEIDSRWLWAVLVDVMAFVMCFWGISGIVMWWQIKRSRWLGAACLGISLAVAVWLGIGMHEAISIAGR